MLQWFYEKNKTEQQHLLPVFHRNMSHFNLNAHGDAKYRKTFSVFLFISDGATDRHVGSSSCKLNVGLFIKESSACTHVFTASFISNIKPHRNKYTWSRKKYCDTDESTIGGVFAGDCRDAEEWWMQKKGVRLERKRSAQVPNGSDLLPQTAPVLSPSLLFTAVRGETWLMKCSWINAEGSLLCTAVKKVPPPVNECTPVF